ncbi:disease resistance protein RGA5-like isoform X2 [Prosopis cineraria]|uniref:disease resistance protein RGA5-like isoform X2 n=1 Tax=Prosopis cineraria TaxID=364024 RepID=UPI00240EEF36|nr:disease resistance protein RGA5-like isoform X2 [Prosopis cineraria]
MYQRIHDGGVISVELEGEDQVKVIGEGVDAVCLTCVLRKKFGFAELLSLQDVTDNGDEGGGGDGRNSSSGDQEPPPAFAYHQFPCPPCAYLIYDPHPYDPPICSVM